MTDRQNEIADLTKAFFEENYSRDETILLSVGISIIITTLDQMIGDHDDLTTVLTYLDAEVFPKIKSLIAENYNNPEIPPGELN